MNNLRKLRVEGNHIVLSPGVIMAPSSPLPMENRTMKTTHAIIIRRFALFLFCFLPATLYGGQQYGMPEAAPTDPASYAVPGEKAQQWETLQNIARKEYNVCVEHCANDSACLDKCEKAYSRRLEFEYHRLTE